MNLKLKLIALFACVLASTHAQDIGANYNETISGPIGEVEQLRKSEVAWVRGFLTVPMLFMTSEEGVVTGIKEQAILEHKPTLDFIRAKKALGEQTKFIMSLKIPFEEFTHGVPELGTTEVEYFYEAAHLILKSHNLAENIDILVMGNEPCFENFTDAVDAERYRKFLSEFADRLAAWKAENGWNFRVYAGALNRVSQLANNKVIPAVMQVVKENDNIYGLDLHIHADIEGQIEADLRDTREKYGITKPLMCSEFSINRAYIASRVGGNVNAAWATKYGYDTSMKFYEYLNHATDMALAGTPVSPVEFREHFEAYPWYIKNWYLKFYEAFKKYDLSVYTGRFSVWGNNPYTETSAMWDLGGIYMQRFMGFNEDGSANYSPLVGDDFLKIKNEILPVLTTLESQNNIFMQWGKSIDTNAKLIVKDATDTIVEEFDIIKNPKYHFISGLTPNSNYTFELTDNSGSSIWIRTLRTDNVSSDYPYLKIHDARDYYLIEVLNLPSDVEKYTLQIDGVDTENIVDAISGDILNATITYSDGAIETISTNISEINF